MLKRRTLLQTVGAGTIAIGATGCIGAIGGDDDDFPSETIEYSVPLPPGSGFDLYARTMSEFMPRHLPNEVDVVIENVVGGALTEQLNYLYDQPGDGHYIGMSSNSVMSHAQVLGRIDFDLDELTYFGVTDQTTAVVATRPDTGIETPEDLQEADGAIWAAGPPGTVGNVQANAIVSELDAPIDIATGFGDVGEQVAAVLRGDADLAEGSTTAAGMRTGIVDGDLHPVMTLREEPYDATFDLSHVPTVADVGLGHLAPIGGFDRIVKGPPDIPEDRKQILVDAVYDTCHDDDFLAQMEEQDAPVNYSDHEVARERNIGMLQVLEDFEQFVEG